MVQIRLDDSFRARSELERRIGERYKVRVTLVNVRSDATPTRPHEPGIPVLRRLYLNFPD